MGADIGKLDAETANTRHMERGLRRKIYRTRAGPASGTHQRKGLACARVKERSGVAAAGSPAYSS